MTWKKLLLIATVAAGLSFAASPRAEAGISVGIGIGFPVGYGYGGYGGYGCSPYRYGYYPYGYPYGYRANYVRYHDGPYYRRARVRGHWHQDRGRRSYCTRIHRRW